jgi:acetylglutamate kinase
VQALIDKAKVLMEALPYMQRFVGKTVVVKYGGAAQKDAMLRASFARDVVLLKHIGVRPVIVHGGGPQIGALLERLGKQSVFVDGLRVTDDETMEVVEMVLGGRVNHEIVELVQQAGGRAIGLTGSDGGMIRVRRRTLDGRDIGRVGEVIGVEPSAITAVADAGFVPVIAPIGVGEDGLTYNVNADEAAGAVAQALRAEKLILLTDVPGVLDAHGKLMPELTRERARALVDSGVIKGGMIPKLECCSAAVQGGVARAHVIDGRVQHAVLLEIFTDGGVGTLVTR